MQLVTCLDDGWVSFVITKSEALSHVRKFNKYFRSLSKKKQREYYRGTKCSLKDYACLVCGGRKFRLYDERIDVDVDGCTINPVIWDSE